jgi:hypothetical protein
MARRERDSKYLRLTGLWPSKNKKGLFTGKLRNQDIGKLIDKLEEAGDADIAFFLWENDAESRKDPEFTLQCTVSDSQGFSGKKKYRRDEEEEEDDRPRSKRRSRDDEEEEEQDEAEEDTGEEDTKSKSKSKADSKSSKTSSKSKSKKDEDW